jgi:hypothetical protein
MILFINFARYELVVVATEDVLEGKTSVPDLALDTLARFTGVCIVPAARDAAHA